MNILHNPYLSLTKTYALSLANLLFSYLRFIFFLQKVYIFVCIDTSSLHLWGRVTRAKVALKVFNPKTGHYWPRWNNFQNRGSANTSHHIKCSLRKTWFFFCQNNKDFTGRILHLNTFLLIKYLYTKLLDVTNKFLHEEASPIVKTRL